MNTTPGKGRLAPSPTGSQHLGNARTYLIAWLSARTQGFELALRIEDIDSPRVKVDASEEAIADLRWLGLDWDGEPVVQTQRLPHYTAARDELKRGELIYPCTCTRSDIEAAASAPHAEHEGAVYPGTCAWRTSTDEAELKAKGKPFAWRFRAAGSFPSFVDRFRGEVTVDASAVGGDFVVWKNIDTPAYQLAVVVDDAAMGITEVVRGDDLIPSTPRQLLLYRALGYTPPQFIHIPLVVGSDGRRLAKRHGDLRLSALRAAGVSPEAVLGLLAWSCGWQAQPAPVTAMELLGRYELSAIPKEVFVLEKETGTFLDAT